MPTCVMHSTGFCILMTQCKDRCAYEGYEDRKHLEDLAKDVEDEDTPYDPR